MAQLVWTTTATHEIAQIFRELAHLNLRAGERWLHEVMDRFDLIAAHPRIGSIVHRSPTEVRQTIVGSFRIFYRIEESDVVLLRALHVRRDYDANMICDRPDDSGAQVRPET